MRPRWWDRGVDWFWRNFSSSLFGITAGDWLRLLEDNHYAIDMPYWYRAWFITLHSLHNSVQRRCEERRYGAAVAATAVPPPLFVLGHWRQGTTHLHNLLTLDPQFAYPNSYQAIFPHTFLSTEATASPWMAYGLPERRPQDNMHMTLTTPAEDEFALCTLTGLSLYTGWVFPRHEERYERYLTFQGASPAEVAVWKAALVGFLKKLTWKYGRPLVLKSPPHTGRIRLLLELFPDARFVHIRRDPYVVYLSTRHTRRAVSPIFTLQSPDRRREEERLLRYYRLLYDAYFEECRLVPPGRLHEMAFEDLEKDPLGQMRLLYERLGLAGFEGVRPALEAYVASLAGYRKNEFRRPPPALGRRIAAAWRRNFDEWGYAV
jgi:hypothetical protein